MNHKNKYEITNEQAFDVIQNIRLKIQQYFCENNLTYAIFGKSEGLDSSVIAGLLSNLEGVKPIGVIMPCESDPESERIAKLVLNHFQIPYINVDLSQEFHFLMEQLYSMDGIHGQLANILKHYNDFQSCGGNKCPPLQLREQTKGIIMEVCAIPPPDKLRGSLAQ